MAKGSIGEGLTLPVIPGLDETAVKRITAKVDELTRSRDVNVKFNGARLDADLKKAQLEMARLTQPKEVVFKAKADLISAKLASAELSAVAKAAGEKSGESFSRGFSRKLDSISSGLGGKGSGLFAGIGLGIAAAGQAAPALVSAIGAVGASFAGTGIAVGVFGAMVKTVLSGASADATSLAALQVKLSDATTKKQRANIQLQINDLEKGWSAGHKSVVTSISGIEVQWKKLSDTIATPVIAPFLDAVSKGMQHLAPLVQPVASVFRWWGMAMDRYFSSSKGSAEINRIATALGKFAGRQLADIGTFFIDAGKAVANLARDMHGVDFGKFGQDLAKWGAAFLSWSSSAKARADVGKFLAWLHGNSGTLVSAVKSLAANLPGVMAGLAKGGGLELKGVTALLTAIGKLPQGVVTILATAVPLVFALSKAVGLVSAAVKVWTAAQEVLDGALIANPIGVIVLAIAALAGAFYLAWTKSSTFRSVVTGVLKDVGKGAITFAEIFLDGMKFVVDSWLNTIGVIVHGAAAAFGWLPGIGSGLRDASKAFDNFHKGVDNTFNSMHDTLERYKKALDGAAGNAAAAAVKKATAAIIGDFTKQGTAAVTAKGALGSYTAAIKANGLNSAAAHAARTALVNDMIKAGVNSKTANADVAAYTRAIASNGVNSDAARSARQRLIADILNTSNNSVQGKRDLAAFTAAVQNHSSKSDQVRSARQRLIQDLVNAGADSRTAAGLVDGLQRSINALHGKSVQVMVDVGAAGSITATAAGALSKAAGLSGTSVSNLAAQLVFGMGHAQGGLISGIGNRDTVPAMLTPGEVVVPKGMVARGAVDHLRGKLPGFANGGRVPGATALLNDEALAGAIEAHWTGGIGVKFGEMIRAAFASKVAAAAKAAAAAMSVPTVATAGSSGGVIATMMRNMAAARGWTGNMWNALYDVEMAEAGFNMTAQNPSSGAYGLAQFINGPSEYAQYGGNATTAIGQITGMLNYIAQRYGNPVNAWAHESAFHWYNKGGKVFDNGGTLDPGANLVYNLTGKPERLSRNDAGNNTVTLEIVGGNSDVEQFIVQLIRKYARVNAGGNVQTAFGKNR